eukprot:scaffold7414_cov116-Cylindrotheca_fusiformis.AAC.3
MVAPLFLATTCNMANAPISLSKPTFQEPQHEDPCCFDGFAEAPKSCNVKDTFTAATSSDLLLSEKQDMDQYLAVAMNSLSSEDREFVLEELNGIAKTHPEDPASLNQFLQEMEQHLMWLKQGTYYEVAEKMDFDYVTDRDFRIMFLRANRYVSNGQQRYDPKRAATQMKIFFDTKYMLFGKDKLVKDITLDDLDDDDKHCLQGGHLQVLPIRDRAGRVIVVNFRGGRKFKSVESKLRARFYLFMSLRNSKEAQEKGLVMIYYSVDQYRDERCDANTISLIGKCMSSFPYHWAGVHVCCDDYKQYIALRGLFCFMPSNAAARVRVQFGNHMECLHALRGYGIQKGSVPLSPTNAHIILKHQALWYQQQYMREKRQLRKETNTMEQQANSPFTTSGGSGFSLQTTYYDTTSLPSPFYKNHSYLITGDQTANPGIVPRPSDVLFGHDYKLHAGNYRLRDILAQYANKYEEAGGRPEKIRFTAQLVQKIKATGTRFLMINEVNRQWVEVADSKARIKIAKSIRNRRRNTKQPLLQNYRRPEG